MNAHYYIQFLDPSPPRLRLAALQGVAPTLVFAAAAALYQIREEL
jgi:hypothetical protein